jgi:ferrous iron transport protein B
VTAYSFLVFNLLCAPCFAAIGAIKREMNNHKWTWFAIGYQCGFAYLIALMINQFGGLFTGTSSA